MIKNGTKRTRQNVINEKSEVSVSHAHSTRTQSHRTYSTSSSLHCTWHSQHYPLTKEHLCESHAVVSTIPQCACVTVIHRRAEVLATFWHRILKYDEGRPRGEGDYKTWGGNVGASRDISVMTDWRQ